jgi:predicted tellurium resistance membrane protein TerC
MLVFLQVVIINLIVSLDNIGVIALATRGLEQDEANKARQLGIWLSLLLKLGFMLIIGFLFSVQWLHIRLIGGLMLLYVIYDMMIGINNTKKI